MRDSWTCEHDIGAIGASEPFKVCTEVQTLKGSLAPIAPISRSQVQESRFCSPRREVHFSRARSFARVAR